MRFSTKGVFAKCAMCRAEDFYPAMPATPDRRDVYVCVRCGHHQVYGELVRELSEKAAAVPAK